MAIVCPCCGAYISDEEIAALTVTIEEKPVSDQCKEFAGGRGT